LLVTLLACGDDTSGTNFPVESGLERGRALGSLANTERTELCQTAVDTAVTFFESDETTDYACTLAASLTSITVGDSYTVHVDEQSCVEARKECLKLPKMDSITGPDCKTLATDLPPTCAATVGEYEDCLERLFDALIDDWHSTTCNSLAKLPLEAWPAARVTGPGQVEGCARLQRDCAGLAWPSVTGAYGQANHRSEEIRDARAAAAKSGGS
jgi:hypothetical protein